MRAEEAGGAEGAEQARFRPCREDNRWVRHSASALSRPRLLEHDGKNRVTGTADVGATLPSRLWWSLSRPVSGVSVAAELNQRVPAWWNWQTRRPGTPLGLGPCEFESHRRHRRALAVETLPSVSLELPGLRSVIATPAGESDLPGFLYAHLPMLCPS